MDVNIEGLYVRSGIISTYTGKYLDTRDPQPDQICIEDIAHQLSMQPRFNGILRKYYSVAQHSIEVALRVAPEYALAALLHDASEAYISDIPSPIKSEPEMERYYEIEARLMKAIAEKFGFKLNIPEVKEVDKFMLEYEWSTLVMGYKPDRIGYMTHYQAKDAFLNLYRALTS